jgi:beta-glucosidase/6-phospho-beta-glucosidase/beta-galactosidase
MFRDDFVWGVASSAYQIEGRDANDGAGAMIWDKFIAEGGTKDGYGAEVACDHMHRYKDDFALMRLMGIKAYRFSISWARLIPEGTGKVNEKAVALYRDMILEMKKNGIEPYLTMYHWEFPQALQDRGGWLNEEVIQWFGEYARVVAENFSDICENFITLNEPECFVGIGHMSGWHAPGCIFRIRMCSRLHTMHCAHMDRQLLIFVNMPVVRLRSAMHRPVVWHTL